MKIGIAINKALHYYVVFATDIYQVNLPPIVRASLSPPRPAVLSWHSQGHYLPSFQLLSPLTFNRHPIPSLHTYPLNSKEVGGG